MSFTANSVGGEYKHKLVIPEIPKHTRGIALFDDGGSQEFYSNALNSKWSKNYKKYDNPVYGEGGNNPHNNIQPYTTVYFWTRTK